MTTPLPPVLRRRLSARRTSRLLLGTALGGMGVLTLGAVVALAQTADHQTADQSTSPSSSATGTSAAPSGTSQQLPTLVVNGTAATETAAGPVAGYVAHRSDAGTKTDTSLVETPQSVSVVSQAQITDQNAQSLNQVLHYTSDVATETRGAVATRYDQMTIRGFDADSYLDGLKLLGNGFYAIPQIDPYFLERVDVLKGPSSVLYGSANAGGLVDQIDKMPTDTPFHEIGLEGGTSDHVQTTFDFSGPLDKDGHWLYRFTGLGRSEDGQIRTTQNERVAVAPAFTWQPDAQTSLTLRALYQRDPKSSSYGSIPPQGTVLYSPYGQLPRDFYDGDTSFEDFDRTQASLAYQFSKKFDDGIGFHSRGRWFHISQTYESVYGSSLEADGRTLDRGTAESRDTSDQYSMDNSVQIPLVTGPVTHKALVGFDFQHLSTDWVAGFGSAPSIDIFDPDNSQVITPPTLTQTRAYLDQYGVYLQDQAKFQNWLLTLSGREDSAGTSQKTAATGSSSSQWDQAFTSRVGLTYLFANGIAPYVSYSESFNPLIGTAADGSAFKPERGAQYEAGVKYQPSGTDTLLTAAVFDLTRKNLETPDLADPALSVQSGEARSRGIELEARAALTDNLSVIANYSFLDTIYTKDNSGLQGKRLAGVPQNMASGWAKYDMPRGLFDGLSVSGGVRYTGTTYNDQNTYTVKSYLLTDASIDYDMGRKMPSLAGLTAYVDAHNLLNVKYVASCYYGNWCAYGYGQQVMGGFRYDW